MVMLCGLASSACSVYTGTAKTLTAKDFRQDPGWMSVQGVPELHQAHELDCGPTALAMVLGYYHAANREEVLKALPAGQRVSVSALRDLAKRYGFEAYVVEGSPDDLVFELQHHRPAIVGVAKPTVKDAVAHYEVVVGMHGKSQRVATLDPAVGLRQNTFTGFLTEWQNAGRVLLVVVPKQPATADASKAVPNS
jgi:ABC-type bacteriocin/lantibiotic exporter with double-glycine peptidase domain